MWSLSYIYEYIIALGMAEKHDFEFKIQHFPTLYDKYFCGAWNVK